MSIPGMRPAALVLSALLATAVAVTNLPATLLNSASAPPERASAPYNNFANCSQCHNDGIVNSGSGSVSISGVPAEYVPDTTYPITVSVAQGGQSRWGYSLTVLDENDDALGALANPDSNSQVVLSVGREFAGHTNGGTHRGTPNGPVSWTVDWIAPPAGGGTAHFFASGNAANNNGWPTGDRIYSHAAAAAESGAPHPDATVLVQANFPNGSGFPPDLSRAGADRLRAEIRVSNHLGSSETFAVATRVRRPGGGYFPASGYLTTQSLTLAPGETGTVRLDKAIPDTTPLGAYRLQALMGYAPATLVDSESFEFMVVP